jgi:hypothetical protein
MLAILAWVPELQHTATLRIIPLLRPLKGTPAADLPLLILPWDRIEQIRTLPDRMSCE